MNRNMHLFIVAAATWLAAACSSGSDSWDDYGHDLPGGNTGGQTSGGQTSGGSSVALTGTLATFDVAFNTAALTETESAPEADDEDYVENFEVTTTVRLSFNGSSVEVGDLPDGITVTQGEGAHVTVGSTLKGVAIEVSGSTTDGGLKIYSEKKFQLTLNGVDIANPSGAAINSQCKKRNYIVLADGTSNTLTDGTSYTDVVDGEDMKATFFSEGQLLFSGKGTLQVNANCKSGICSDDYIVFRPGNNIQVNATAAHAIKSNDGIWVKGGVINAQTTADASKALKTDGYVIIDGGRVTCLTSGAGVYDSDEQDVTGAAGVKCDGTFTMNGGELLCKSTGKGGKGVSADSDILINGGTVRIITTGAKSTVNRASSSPKGLKSDADITIAGGDVMVRCLGGEGSEGIESKGTLTVSGGTVASYCYDDAINAATHIGISGGSVFAYATNNDGIDSNGTLTVSGGLAIACGTTDPEDGFDCDQNTFTVSGGTLIGLGGGTSSPSASTAKQPVAIVGSLSLTAGQWLTLATSDGNVFAFQLPRSYNGGTLLVSSPQLKTGSECILANGASVTDSGNSFYGYLSNATATGGTTLATLTLSSTLTTSGYSGGMGGPGGGQGGFRW